MHVPTPSLSQGQITRRFKRASDNKCLSNPSVRGFGRHLMERRAQKTKESASEARDLAASSCLPDNARRLTRPAQSCPFQRPPSIIQRHAPKRRMQPLANAPKGESKVEQTRRSSNKTPHVTPRLTRGRKPMHASTPSLLHPPRRPKEDLLTSCVGAPHGEIARGLIGRRRRSVIVLKLAGSGLGAQLRDGEL